MAELTIKLTLTFFDFDFIDEKCSKIFSLVSWGIFLLSAFYIKQVKLSTIGYEK